jgi:hypothetical protein
LINLHEVVFISTENACVSFFINLIYVFCVAEVHSFYLLTANTIHVFFRSKLLTNTLQNRQAYFSLHSKSRFNIEINFYFLPRLEGGLKVESD